MRFSRPARRSCGVVAFIVALSVCTLVSPVHASDSTRRVFLLDGLSATDASVRGIADTINARLKERSSNIDVYSDFLDLHRFQGPGNEDRVAENLRAKFAQVRPDIVIPIGTAAVQFVVRRRAELIGDIPVIYCCTPVAPSDAQSPAAPTIVTRYDWVGTLALAQRLQPNARRLVIISGDSESEPPRDAEAMNLLMPLLHNYDVKYLTGLPRDELLKEVSHFPRDSIVLLRSVFEGRARSVNLAYDVAKLSTAPVYSSHATDFGTGIVGGRMDSFKAQAMKAADLALDKLSGRKDSALPRQIELPLQTRVDSRALTRWGLNESNLPREASIEFAEPTLWQQYRTAVTLNFIGFVALGAIIASLLIQGSKLRAAKTLLKECEERMAFAAASVNIGIWRMELPSGQLWATEHCRSMFGIDADAPLTWENFRNAVHPEDHQIFDQWVKSLLPSPRLRRTEFRIQSSVHSPRWYLSRQYTVSGDNGQTLQICGVFVDVTERKLAEEQAQTQRAELTHMMRVSAVGELSGGLAHELSQPLAAILANAQAAQTVLAQRDQGDDLFAEIVDDVVREVERATQVVHGLRRLLRKGKCEASPASLNDLVTSTFALIHSELVNRRISIETELERDLPPIFCDRVQIQQVILNLMMNAMDAMGSTPAQSRLLRVATRAAEGEGVELSVLDRGPGLSSDEFKQLFRPFFTTKPHGLGLGLSICSTIVKSHRGRLDIANAKGGGTIAIVWLPSSVQLARAS
jgi:signal transduction histidine kinase